MGWPGWLRPVATAASNNLRTRKLCTALTSLYGLSMACWRSYCFPLTNADSADKKCQCCVCALGPVEVRRQRRTPLPGMFDCRAYSFHLDVVDLGVRGEGRGFTLKIRVEK